MVRHWYLSAPVIFLVYLIQRASDKNRRLTTPLSHAIAYSVSTSHPPYPWKDIEALVCVPDVLCFTISSPCGRERSKHFRRGRPRLPFLILSTLVPCTILFTVLPLTRNEGGGSYSSPMGQTSCVDAAYYERQHQRTLQRWNGF